MLQNILSSWAFIFHVSVFEYKRQIQADRDGIEAVNLLKTSVLLRLLVRCVMYDQSFTASGYLQLHVLFFCYFFQNC